MTQNEHIYAICCRSEVAGDVISGENVKTTKGYAVLYSEVTSFSTFRYIKQGNHHNGDQAARLDERPDHHFDDDLVIKPASFVPA